MWNTDGCVCRETGGTCMEDICVHGEGEFGGIEGEMGHWYL